MINNGKIVDKVSHSIIAHNLIEKGDDVLVGLSGGPDSVALLHILTNLRDRLGISLGAAYINHRLRPRAAAAEARFCAELCRVLSVRYHYRGNRRSHSGPSGQSGNRGNCPQISLPDTGAAGPRGEVREDRGRASSRRPGRDDPVQPLSRRGQARPDRYPRQAGNHHSPAV